ncbi:Protein of unknown function [Duganella sp. CF517]|uniref:DUF1700 domain-containing protein n=1 Tax=Duganella sp. CF517 TaxID=1881038 RepID=UPI0008BF5873|nr:DUF1700 domain-containing protein [Duganella sp. CF517]SEN86822.1 Protein of unknown function [Duganella sp. CF517]
MSKQQYLDALKQAMQGLPPETVAKTLAYYEQRFIDGLVAGKSEAEVYKELDEPRKIAMTLRASAHLNSFEQKKTPANLVRVMVSFVGLAVFNLFMVIPAMVYAAMLLAVYVSAFAFYIGGVAVTASGLSGQNELSLEGPLHHVMALTHSRFDTKEEEAEAKSWRIAINDMGIQISKAPGGDDEGGAETVQGTSRASRLFDRAEAVASGDVHITTDFDSGARTTQTFIGFGLILAGIGLCLISIVLTRYTVIGLRRYAAMNMSLLRGR